MSEKCSSCEKLKKNNLDVVRKGVSDANGANLKNDKGFNGKSTDCSDLHDLNECFIGAKTEGIDGYDECNWKGYLVDFGSNVYEVFRAVIFAICGLWTNVHDLWNEIQKIYDLIDQIQQSITVNGKIEVARNIDISGNNYLIKPVDLGNVSDNTRISINWRAGSTRRVDSYYVRDLRENNCHIYGGNMVDMSNSEDVFEVFTGIKPGTNSLWITTVHRRSLSSAGVTHWNAEPWDSNGHVYYNDQDPRYADTREGNLYHAIIIEELTVYDLVDPIDIN
ncbi:hypothetical protein [Enterococcus sp. DIV0800]|uniref:hypothetical protein n=1 Tax=unclassified Enterococcus TaxID=2608891 RepID=UPI003D2FD7E7